MAAAKRIPPAVLALVLGCIFALAADFQWDWHNQEVIGRNDPGLGNTSKLTEPERNALLDAVIVRLLKPMTEQGYDDARIREIALTTRLRFLDLGEDKPVIMATSLGLEGGCDALVNCPFWIFRHTPDGYVSLLETRAASYTIQPTSSNGWSDLVISRHNSPQESRLTLYKFDGSKYADAGCYTATWPPAKDGEIQEPAIAPCQAEQRQ
ncbi:MAG TPA: hypothetical protein VL240_05850 [Candidatus Binatia bacterium]|nr:hypothetical protein [Candidatus Binatia bacterium]